MEVTAQPPTCDGSAEHSRCASTNPAGSLQHSNLHQVIHPIGADLHFLLDVEDPNEQLDFLQELKNRFRRTDAKMVFGNAHPDLRLQDLGEFGRSTAYSFTQRLQRHLDPAGVFHAPFIRTAMNAS